MFLLMAFVHIMQVMLEINFLDDEEYIISINMEIKCEESSEELFSRVKL